jgi:hypothetical protein
VTTTGETAAGFNTQRLERLHDGLQGLVDSGEYAGIGSLLMRGGQVADAYVYGMQDVETRSQWLEILSAGCILNQRS